MKVAFAHVRLESQIPMAADYLPRVLWKVTRLQIGRREGHEAGPLSSVRLRIHVVTAGDTPILALSIRDRIRCSCPTGWKFGHGAVRTEQLIVLG